METRRVPIHIEQEGGSSGEYVVDAYQRRVLRGFAVYPVKPVVAREVRALPFASAAEAGNVFQVAVARNRDFLNETEGVFGSSATHDDPADAASGAHEGPGGRPVPVHPRPRLRFGPGGAVALQNTGLPGGGRPDRAATRRAAVEAAGSAAGARGRLRVGCQDDRAKSLAVCHIG